MMTKTVCAWCGKEIQKYPSQLKHRNFCSRECLAAYSNKTKNPNGYRELKDYTNNSAHMSAMNREMNVSRMDFPTRAKLSFARRGSGAGKAYAKSFGVHTHRRVAEKILGRKLEPGEVVHHIDGNKRNNNPNNLRIFSSQAEHARWHSRHEGGDAL